MVPDVVVRFALPPMPLMFPPDELMAALSAPFCSVPPARFTPAWVCVVWPRSSVPPLIVVVPVAAPSVPAPDICRKPDVMNVPPE